MTPIDFLDGSFFMNKWIGLAVGSILGGFSRYLLAGWIYRFTGADFPYGTFIVNVSGCFLIGLFYSFSEVRFLIGPDARLFLMTGFCGAYTTFSTLILETANLAQDGEMARALFNFLASGIFGFILFKIGAYLGALA